MATSPSRETPPPAGHRRRGAGRRRSGLAFALALGSAAALWGADAAPPRINRIVIAAKPGQTVSRAVVLADLRLQEGQPFDAEMLSQDLRRLFATRYYYDIRVDVEAAGPERVNLLYTLDICPRVRRITIQGCRELDPHTVREKLKQRENEPLAESQLSADLEAVYALLAEKGYTAAEVRQRLVPVADGVDVVYDLVEAPRVKVWRVRFVGNRVFAGEELQQRLATCEVLRGSILMAPLAATLKSTLPFLAASYYDELVLLGDLDLIREAYWERGYLDARVTRVEKRFGHTLNLLGYGRRDTVEVTIHLDEGEPYRVTRVDLDGNQKFAAAELTPLLQQTAGQRYGRGRETADVQRLSRQYQKLGYVDVSVQALLSPDPATHEVAVTYRIREGTPARVRHIDIAGNQLTKDKVIRRELALQPGDLADRTQLRATEDRLRGLGYFKAVAVTPVPTGDDDWRDLQIQVDETETGLFNLSAGLSDTENLMGRITFGQGNFDLFNPWNGFRGGGQRFKIETSISRTSQSYSLTFTEPWLLDRELRLDLGLWDRDTSTSRKYDEHHRGGQAKFTRRLPWTYWRAYVGGKADRVDIGDLDPTFSPAFLAAEDGPASEQAVLLGLSRDGRNSFIRPTSGTQFTADLAYQADALGSYTDAYTLTLGGEGYLPLKFDAPWLPILPHAPVFKLSGELGQLNHLAGTDVRVFDRFFAGGLGSVRGFETRAIGPRDPRNLEPVGGTALMLLSAELVQPLVEDKLYTVVFADAGNVWARSWDWQTDELNVGVGLGLRVVLPQIGTIVLDYGWPVHRTDDWLDEHGRIHFNISYSFF